MVAELRGVVAGNTVSRGSHQGGVAGTQQGVAVVQCFTWWPTHSPLPPLASVLWVFFLSKGVFCFEVRDSNPSFNHFCCIFYFFGSIFVFIFSVHLLIGLLSGFWSSYSSEKFCFFLSLREILFMTSNKEICLKFCSAPKKLIQAIEPAPTHPIQSVARHNRHPT